MTPLTLYGDHRFRKLLIRNESRGFCYQKGTIAGMMVTILTADSLKNFTGLDIATPYARLCIRMGNRLLKGYVSWEPDKVSGWWPDVTDADRVELLLRLAE